MFTGMSRELNHGFCLLKAPFILKPFGFVCCGQSEGLHHSISPPPEEAGLEVVFRQPLHRWFKGKDTFIFAKQTLNFTNDTRGLVDGVHCSI